MKLYALLKPLLVLLLFCAVACQSNSTTETAMAQTAGEAATAPTVIYLVRHAEKETSDPKNEDPDLTAAGAARAVALRDLLEGQPVDALYATKYIRTKNTLKPLADARQLEMEEYEAHDFDNLKAKILQQHRGQTVVVAGHSNTILPIIEAFGATRPVPEIADGTYDHLFRMTVPAEGSPAVETSRFGAASH